MKINRDSEMYGGLKNRKKAGIVKKHAIGSAIQKSAAKAEVGDTAFQFDGCGCRILESQGGEAAESGRIGLYSVGQLIVDVASERAGCGGVERIESHRGEGQDLEIDECFIHCRNSAGADIEELGLKRYKRPGSSVGIGSGSSEEGLSDKMLFKRNGAHCSYLVNSNAVAAGVETTTPVPED